MIIKTINLNTKALVQANEKLIVTIGAFDGLHIGHKKLFLELQKEKEARGSDYKIAVLTFSKHPDFYLMKRDEKNIIETDENKYQSFNEYGVDYVFLLEKEVLGLTYQDFHQKILDLINTKMVIVGKDFKYGYQAKGNVSTLEKDYLVKSFLIVHNSGEKVSSSEIRELLKMGKIEETNNLLGRNYFIESPSYKIINNQCIFESSENMVKILNGTYHGIVKNNDFTMPTKVLINENIISFEINDQFKQLNLNKIKLELINKLD